VLLKGLKSLDQFGERGQRSTGAALLAEALYRQDRLDEAEDMARRAEESTASGDIWTASIARGTLAKVLARRGDPGAEVLARDAVDLLAQTDGFELRGGALLNLAEVLEATGKHDEALDSARAALALFEEEENLVVAARAGEIAARLEARLTPVEDRGDRAS
jgi:ATP/maltotriose-dependent transcriptional regulator MalT